MKDRTSKLLERCEEARRLLEQGRLSPDAAGTMLFEAGYELDYSGKREAAETVYQQTIEILEELSNADKGALSQSTLGAMAFKHGKALVKLGRTRAAIGAFRRAIEVFEVLLYRGAHTILLEQRASSYAWLALAQRKSGLFQEACKNYAVAVDHWEKLPAMIGAHYNPYTGVLGATLLGYSRALAHIGDEQKSAECMQQAQDLLKDELKILSGSVH